MLLWGHSRDYASGGGLAEETSHLMHFCSGPVGPGVAPLSPQPCTAPSAFTLLPG